MKSIEKNIDYNEKTKLYRLRIMINGKRKAYYSQIYEEVKTLKDKIIDAKKNGNLNKLLEEIKDNYNPLVYFISDGEFCKIGVTTNIKDRMRTLQTGTHRKLKLLTTHECNNPFELEKFLHNLFKTKHISGEWYDILELFGGEKNGK